MQNTISFILTFHKSSGTKSKPILKPTTHPLLPFIILISLTVCRLLFVKFGISFSLFQFHFMLAPHNFSGSVALNYESYTRNWTVNFTRDKMYFFTTTSLQAAVYPLSCGRSKEIIVFLLNCAIKVGRAA